MLQQRTGYNLSNYVELTMQRYKRIVGNALKARSLPQQKAETMTNASTLNRMTSLGSGGSTS